jgi:PAS domain S-box-containing protein
MVRDLKGVIQFWNSGAEALYGWRRDEVLGKSLHEVLQTEFPNGYVWRVIWATRRSSCSPSWA